MCHAVMLSLLYALFCWNYLLIYDLLVPIYKSPYVHAGPDHGTKAAPASHKLDDDGLAAAPALLGHVGLELVAVLGLGHHGDGVVHVLGDVVDLGVVDRGEDVVAIHVGVGGFLVHQVEESAHVLAVYQTDLIYDLRCSFHLLAGPSRWYT